MRRSANWVVQLGLAGGLFWAGAAPAQAAPPNASSGGVEGICLNEVPPCYREKMRLVIEHPTLHTRGPVEVFRGQPVFYHWLMDHPDKAVMMWRRMGARCTEITDRGNGRFGYSDKQGSDIAWDTVHRAEGKRIWFAEGAASPGPVFPLVPVRAVVILRYTETPDSFGRIVIHHQAELWMQTDSKAAALMAKFVGSSAPKLAEQCVGQLELFFSALVYYIDRHPERVEALVLSLLPPTAPSTLELRRAFAASPSRELPPRNSYNAVRMMKPMAD
jgi:hypothetical protein